jgi:hypothetical protein
MVQLIERARADLRREDDRAEGVHEARKAFKKARAVTRLVRGALGTNWRAQDRFWRDLGRALSAERDAQAVVEAFDALLGPDAQAPAFASLRDLLVRRHAALSDSTGEVVRFPDGDAGESDSEIDLDGQLAAAEERVRTWPLKDTFGPLAAGLEEGYRRAYTRGRRARREPSATNLHTWRRAVKQHAAQVRLFREAAPGPLSAHLELADELADVLGHDHDLEVLRSLLTEEDAAWSDPGVLDVVLERMARRHAVLRRSAFSLGERTLAERPAAFRRRMRGYWRAFVRDQAGERAVPAPAAAEDVRESGPPGSASPDQAAG